jgi:hypothetical protein
VLMVGSEQEAKSFLQDYQRRHIEACDEWRAWDGDKSREWDRRLTASTTRSANATRSAHWLKTWCSRLCWSARISGVEMSCPDCERAIAEVAELRAEFCALEQRLLATLDAMSKIFNNFEAKNEALSASFDRQLARVEAAVRSAGKDEPPLRH